MTFREDLQRIEYQIWKDGAVHNGDRHDYGVDAILAAVRKRVEEWKVFSGGETKRIEGEINVIKDAYEEGWRDCANAVLKELEV